MLIIIYSDINTQVFPNGMYRTCRILLFSYFENKNYYKQYELYIYIYNIYIYIYSVEY